MRTGRVQPLPPISTCFGANREGMTILRHDANEEGPVLLVLPFDTTQTGWGQSPSSLFQHNANGEGMTMTPLIILPFVTTPMGRGQSLFDMRGTTHWVQRGFPRSFFVLLITSMNLRMNSQVDVIRKRIYSKPWLDCGSTSDSALSLLMQNTVS